jgi:CRISPR-associated endoribonuclease Cas6
MLYSILLEFVVRHAAAIPVTMGQLTHALFLNLVKQFDPALSTRLHDEPAYRPYTISPLSGGTKVGERFRLHHGQLCYLRITLLDGGALWHALQRYFLEAGPIGLHLGDANLQLTRMLSTPHTDLADRAGSTDWQTLVTLPAQRTITLYFSSPTAFSLCERQFALFLEPPLVWESLLRIWNRYAPAHMYMEKQVIREARLQQLVRAELHLEKDIDVPRSDREGFGSLINLSMYTPSPPGGDTARVEPVQPKDASYTGSDHQKKRS